METISTKCDQPIALPSIPAQNAESFSLPSMPFHGQVPASIIHGSDQPSLMQHDIYSPSQSLHGKFDFENERISDINTANIEVQYPDLSQTEPFNSQLPVVAGSFDRIYQGPGYCGSGSDSCPTPNTSIHLSPHFLSDSKRPQAPNMERCFDRGFEVSQNFTNHSNSAQLLNLNPYLEARYQRPQDFIYHPNSAQTSDMRGRFDVSDQATLNFLNHSSIANPPNSGSYSDPNYLEPSKFAPQLNHSFFSPGPAVMNPLNQSHEILPLMDNPHFHQCRSYDSRHREEIVHYPSKSILYAANALQNVLTQEDNISRAAEQAYMARMERYRIGDCPPVKARHEKRLWLENGTSQHFQEENVSDNGRIGTERKYLNSTSKSPILMETIVFTTPTSPENFTDTVRKDDERQLKSPAKKRRNSGSRKYSPPGQGLDGSSPIFLQGDALSAPELPLTLATSSKIDAKAPTVSLQYVNLSQIAAISPPIQQHAQSGGIPNIVDYSGSFNPFSSSLNSFQCQIKDKILSPLILGPDYDTPWPISVPRPVGRRQIPAWKSASPSQTSTTIADRGQYQKTDLCIDSFPMSARVPVILSNGQDVKPLLDEILSENAIPVNDKTVFCVLDLSDATESCAGIPSSKRRYNFSFRHRLIVERQFVEPFWPYGHPDIGKVTFTEPATIPQDLDIENMDNLDGV